MSTCVNWVKKVPRSAVDENFNFFDFSKNFQNEENHHIFTPGQLKYTKFTHLDGKMCTCVNWAKKVPSSEVGENDNLFLFFKTFSKMKKIIIFSLQDN